MAMKDSLVFYPFPGMGHLVPIVEIAKLFLPHNFDVAIVLMDTPYNPPQAVDFIAGISASYPSITFHHLPPHSAVVDHPNPFVSVFEHMRHSNIHLHNFLSSHSKVCKVRALVLDFFCTNALDVAAELALPAYLFFSSGGHDLAVSVYFPTLTEILDKNLEEMGEELVEIPGCPPIPASHFPNELRNKNSDITKTLLYHFARLPKADRILVNTFEYLEHRPLQALRAGLCTPGRGMPPIHCIGPVIADRTNEEKHECLSWLDSQPRKSVVFLCFGSMGAFKAEQLKEIAEGLEACGQRFVWVVRAPSKDGNVMNLEALAVEPELEVLLPEGFLERTKGRGMVVKKWAPQSAVLGHEAVGGFVTHCGWNSILESIVNGVPMIAWPLYAEQRMNKVFLVEEMKLAVVMEGYDKEMVEAKEVEGKVRWLMASDGGNELRERAEATKTAATEARSIGGSSYEALGEIIKALRN